MLMTTQDQPMSERVSLVTDPVCGMQFHVANSAAEVWHDMHVHHFCSSECRDAFVSEPERFWPPAQEIVR